MKYDIIVVSIHIITHCVSLMMNDTCNQGDVWLAGENKREWKEKMGNGKWKIFFQSIKKNFRSIENYI